MERDENFRYVKNYIDNSECWLELPEPCSKLLKDNIKYIYLEDRLYCFKLTTKVASQPMVVFGEGKSPIDAVAKFL